MSDIDILLKRLHLSAEGTVPLHVDHYKKDCRDAADEIKHLLSVLNAPLSPKELKLVDKHCGEWMPFMHAWNAVMKERRNGHQ